MPVNDLVINLQQQQDMEHNLREVFFLEDTMTAQHMMKTRRCWQRCGKPWGLHCLTWVTRPHLSLLYCPLQVREVEKEKVD